VSNTITLLKRVGGGAAWRADRGSVTSDGHCPGHPEHSARAAAAAKTPRLIDATIPPCTVKSIDIPGESDPPTLGCPALMP
jgi:hypothetical protein